MKLHKSKSILILGGGAVGVELAAEIIDYYGTNKSITIVDGCSTLLPLLHPSTRTYATEWLKNRNVKVLLNQRIEKFTTTSCTLVNGDSQTSTTLHADLVYNCLGTKPNSFYMERDDDESLSSTATSRRKKSDQQPQEEKKSGAEDSKNNEEEKFVLDRRGCIFVKDTLELDGIDSNHTNVFVCGDVSSPPTESIKQAFQASIQGNVVATNILRKEEDPKSRLLRYPYDIAQYDQLPLIYVLSLGRYDGCLGFNGLHMTGPVTSVVKFILEYTKVMEMKEILSSTFGFGGGDEAASRRHFFLWPLGKLIWKFGDFVTLFLSRTVLKPTTHSKVE